MQKCADQGKLSSLYIQTHEALGTGGGTAADCQLCVIHRIGLKI